MLRNGGGSGGEQAKRAIGVCMDGLKGRLHETKTFRAQPQQQSRGARAHKRTPRFKTRTEVLLREDVAGTGSAGEVRKVRKGFARNSLVPSKAAVYAKPATLSSLGFAADALDNGRKAAKSTSSKRTASEAERLQALKRDLLDYPLVFRVAVNKHSQKMSQPLSATDISRRILEQKKIHLPPSAIALQQHQTLYGLGEHHVPLHITQPQPSSHSEATPEDVFPLEPYITVSVRKRR